MVYYYKNKFPSIDDIVIARVDKISPFGIEVSLNEYNWIKGFINCSEVSRKKKVNFNKLLTIGKDVLLNVIQVDEIKCMIDLSKRTIGDEDIKTFNEKHKLHINLYNIFKYIFIKMKNVENESNLNQDNLNQDELYNFMCDTLFEIQTLFSNEYINECILLKDKNMEILNLIDNKKYDLEKLKNILDNYIDNKINRIKPELTENIKLMTYSSSGLSDIKYALDYKTFDIYDKIIKDYKININYITGSIYIIIITQNEFENNNEYSIENVMNEIKNEIKKRAIEKNIQNQINL